LSTDFAFANSPVALGCVEINHLEQHKDSSQVDIIMWDLAASVLVVLG
jgi:hypothetical protein